MPAGTREADADAAPHQDNSATPHAVTLTWTVHLARRRPQRLLGLLAVLGAVVLGGLLLFHNLLPALLPALALVFTLSEYLFPIRYSLTREAAQARWGLMTVEMPWRDVRHAYLTEDGVKLSPLRRKNSRFESLRGLWLRFDVSNREAVIAAVRLGREGANDDA